MRLVSKYSFASASIIRLHGIFPYTDEISQWRSPLTWISIAETRHPPCPLGFPFPSSAIEGIPLPGAEAKEAAPRNVKSGGVERDYRAGKLTEAQEKIVIALAKKQGVEKVARISTINFYPSSARGIRVDGAKEVNGREVSYKVLSVNFKPWFHPGGGPRKGDVPNGRLLGRQGI